MTATHVDGTAVITDEPALTQLRNRAGGPVHYRKIRHLLLADGRELYGCAQCDYTAPTTGQVRPHLNKHRGSTPRPQQEAPGLDVDALMTRLAQGDAAQTQLTEMHRDRDQWRRRARKAERELATIRRVLTPTT